MNFPEDLTARLKSRQTKSKGKRRLAEEAPGLLQVVMVSDDSEAIDSNLADWSVNSFSSKHIDLSLAIQKPLLVS